MRFSRVAVLGVLVVFPAAALAWTGLSGGAGDALRDPATYDYLWNSVVLGLAAATLSVIFSAPFALVAAFRTFPGRGLLEAAILVPLLVPAHVHTIGWMRIFGRQGYLTESLAAATGYVHEVRAPFCGVYLGPAWILACNLFPLVAVPALSALRAVDTEAVAAARLAGAGRLRTLLSVILPSAWPRIAAGAFLVFAAAIGSFPTTSLLDTPVLAQRVFFAFSRPNEGIGGAAVQAAPLLLIAALFAWLLPEAMRRGGESFVRTAGGVRSGLSSFFLAAAAPALTAIPPLYGLAGKVIEGTLRRPDEPSPFRTVFLQVKSEFANSLLLGVSGAVLIVLIAWPLAWGLARRPSPRFEALLSGAAALPPVLLGLGVVVGWRACADLPVIGLVYASGAGLVLAAYAARFLPIALRMLSPAFDAEAAAQDDAARLAGAGPWRRAWSILRPLQSGAVLGVLTLCYVLCFTELDATLMTYPPELRTVQVRIFNMVHYSRDEEVAALCLLSVAAALIPPLFFATLRRNADRRTA